MARTREAVVVAWCRMPRRRNHISMMKLISRRTTVTAEREMKSGLRLIAPTSDMQAMRWPGSMLAIRGLQGEREVSGRIGVEARARQGRGPGETK